MSVNNKDEDIGGRGHRQQTTSLSAQSYVTHGHDS